MALVHPPRPPQRAKKAGLGCCGCGCLILGLIALLVVGLMAGLGFVAYENGKVLTSAAPANIPNYTASAEVYNGAEQKVTAFNQDIANHHASTLKLTADEINALIAHNPEINHKTTRINVTIPGPDLHLQASLPTDEISHGYLKGRYLNFESDLGVGFDSSSHQVVLTPHTLKLGDTTLLGSADDTSASAAFNRAFLKSFLVSFNQAFNEGLRKSPGGAQVLDQIQSVSIKDSELQIEAQ